MSQIQWELVANIATALGILLAAGGLFVLIWQVLLQRRDQKNQAIAGLFEELLTPEFRQQLVFLYSRKPQDLVLSKLTKEERDKVDEVTARFEGIGFKVRKGLVPKREAIEGFWDWVVRCAQQTQHYVQDQRERRGASETYRKDFEYLARECKLFHLERLGDRTPTRGMKLEQLLEMQPLPVFQVEEPPERDSPCHTQNPTPEPN
jgi:hypothetical protein